MLWSGIAYFSSRFKVSKNASTSAIHSSVIVHSISIVIIVLCSLLFIRLSFMFAFDIYSICYPLSRHNPQLLGGQEYIMKFLISKRSPLPIRVKAFFRCALWHLRLYQMKPSFYNTTAHPTTASYSWRGHCIGFLEDGGGMCFRW